MSARWPGLWIAARLQVTLFWYTPHCLCVNQVVLMLTRCIHMTKANRMKKQSNKSKWRTYTLLILLLIPSPVRKEKQFSLPDDFSEFNFTIFSRTSHSAFGFPALFRVFTSPAGVSVKCGPDGGGRRMADGGWRMADGGWRMADGGWRMEKCGW